MWQNEGNYTMGKSKPQLTLSLVPHWCPGGLIRLPPPSEFNSNLLTKDTRIPLHNFLITFLYYLQPASFHPHLWASLLALPLVHYSWVLSPGLCTQPHSHLPASHPIPFPLFSTCPLTTPYAPLLPPADPAFSFFPTIPLFMPTGLTSQAARSYTRPGKEASGTGDWLATRWRLSTSYLWTMRLSMCAGGSARWWGPRSASAWQTVPGRIWTHPAAVVSSLVESPLFKAIPLPAKFSIMACKSAL